MRVLVTGGSGFVGANLVHRLIGKGHDVHLLLRPEARRWRLAGVEGAYVAHSGSVSDQGAVARAIDGVQPDWIFHCAAHGGYAFETDLCAMVDTNVVGTTHILLEAQRSGAVLVNTGSSSEYGDIDHAPTEDEPPRPNSYYSATKAAATSICSRAAQDGAPVTTLRLYNVYGPFEDPRRLMPTLVAHALDGGWPALVAPWVVRDLIHVDDVVNAYLVAAEGIGDAPPVLNIGTGVQTSLRELADLTSDAFGIRSTPTFGTYDVRQWDTLRWQAEPSRAAASIGWRPAISLGSGLLLFAEWLKAHRDVYPTPAAQKSP